ncbi:LCP family protein [Anaeroselena agilis]|uniref:LCP family protein n=1 Tax=Anaeroselena agilis TaxID=3063788 RepID=A0ABU3P1T2_9FIRM|nr:LCP family protein [Selenomonadales bacterium 4137-cl]
MTTRLERRLSEQRTIHKRRNWLVATCIILFLLTVGASYIWFGGTLSNWHRVVRTGGLLFSADKINVLVLGVDERSGDVGRSDTMFAVTVDTGSKEAALLSVPRDTRVKIPGRGWDKINHAYANGREKLSQQAAEELLGIPFDYYVVINFASFGKIVDAVGGVDIDVEKRMYYRDPYDDLLIDFRPGPQHMNGKTAIKYVRYRGEDGDIGRIERQQKFIKAMLEKVTSPSIITRVPAIIREVSTAVNTNMSTGEMLSMAKLLNDAHKKGLKTDMVPGRPAYIHDISYWLPDIVALREHIARIQGGELSGKQLAEAEKLAAEYERSIPREMKVHEAPKAAAPTKEPAAKPAKKPAAAPKASPPVPGKIAVAVVNASGNPGLGPKMAGILKARGFQVTGVTTSAAPVSTTLVVSYSTSGTIVNQLTSLPFKYVLQIKNERQAVDATVYIGKDYK